MKVFSAVVLAVLLAGINAAVNDVYRDAGGYFAFWVLAVGQSITTCRLTTPAGVNLDFTPGAASQHGNRYQLQPISDSMPTCSVLVSDLQSSDNGVWEIAFLTAAGTGASQKYQLQVTGTEAQESEESHEINDETIHSLNVIEFPTTTGQFIDISLPRIDYEEDCSIRTPDKQYIEASQVNLEGVTVHKSSYFVSCRITIGPMTESLLGEWAVCGKYTENDEEHERCQLAKINWNTETHPDTNWHTNVQTKFNHPVHFESTLNPAVIGNGDVVACHIITPDGEDLVINQDSMYPSIKASYAHSICSFTIGPIHQGLLGDWAIYGLFRNSIQGLNEERLPFEMFLYDEENPINQAYNLTVVDPVKRAVNLGNTLDIEISASAGQVDSCYFQTPSSGLYQMGHEYVFHGASFVEGNDGSISCRVAVGPITEALLGDWKIIAKFSNNGIFTERQQTFHLILEDPENPIQDDRQIIYLTTESVNIEMGRSDRLAIPSHEFINAESCHIRTPNDLQYQVMKGFTAIPGIEVIEDDGVECGVIITALSEDIIGEWTLIARASHHSEPIERRLPFVIYVTESVEALQNAITLTEGDDLYVSLKYPTAHHESCKLIGPYGFECQSAVRDPHLQETCGFIRKGVQSFNTGTWTITFGDRVGYKAEIAVIVNGGDDIISSTPPSTSVDEPSSTSTLNVVRDRSVEQNVGPENAVYCRLEDPQGLAIFDDFGRCHLSLDKVGLEHHGTWKMLVAAPGRILTEEHLLIVNVRESEGKAAVTTHVAQAKPIVTISCSVQPNSAVTGCKFRNPQGKILIAASGLAEDRFDFYGKGASYESGVLTHECGIRITDPLTTDLGLWRCALETAEETYYGHMPVLCPWALSNPATAAAVQQEPILKATRSLVNVVEEETATMSCNVESVIRYCYFRAANGTIFTVTPGMSSSSMEYVGAGFDAGECGIRFHGMNAPDSGRWSCHVGLNGVADEQRDQFQVTVHERMQVRHFTSHGNVMTVEGIVHEGRSLEYCRFVRIDGFGFTTENVPSQYVLTGILANGECQFQARDPTILDLHPWTIAARIRGQDVEISKDTMESVIIGAPEGTEPEEDNPGTIIIYRNNGIAIFMYVFLSLLLVSIILGGLLGPKKNRQWTSQRASAFRRSLSNSFKRERRDNAAPTYTP